MSWDIVYTAGARRDLRDIYEYIAYELLVPETAAGQTQRIMKEIRALDVKCRCGSGCTKKNRGTAKGSVFSLLIITLCFICRMKPETQ
jgi:plasmid stabilization system protein ParE